MSGAAEKHFDVPALLTQVHNARVGLEVKTNHAAGFRRIIYKAMKEAEYLRVRIFQKSGDTFYLIKPAALSPTADLPESPPVEDFFGDF